MYDISNVAVFYIYIVIINRCVLAFSIEYKERKIECFKYRILQHTYMVCGILYRTSDITSID